MKTRPLHCLPISLQNSGNVLPSVGLKDTTDGAVLLRLLVLSVSGFGQTIFRWRAWCFLMSFFAVFFSSGDYLDEAFFKRIFLFPLFLQFALQQVVCDSFGDYSVLSTPSDRPFLFGSSKHTVDGTSTLLVFGSTYSGLAIFFFFGKGTHCRILELPHHFVRLPIYLDLLFQCYFVCFLNFIVFIFHGNLTSA